MILIQTESTNVVGDYIVRVRMHNYSNPHSLLIDSTQCCDQPCGEPSCDTVFHYCLRILGTPSDEDGECTNSAVYKRSLVNCDDAPLNFSQPIVLGLQNPLSLADKVKKEWKVSCSNRTFLHVQYSVVLFYNSYYRY